MIKRNLAHVKHYKHLD